MKTRIFIPFLIFAALMFSACTPAVMAPSETEVAPSADMKPPEVFIDSETGQTVIGKCSRSAEDIRLLINSVHQYCLQYPAEYDLFYPNESEMILVKRFVLNTSEPSVSIKVQPTGGLTVKQAADQIAEVYAIPGIEPVRESLIIDGETAIMLDVLSGQDPNRQVVILHNGYLYHFYFIRINKNQPEVYAQSEMLYRTVIQSFNFRLDSNACPGCPAPEENP